MIELQGIARQYQLRGQTVAALRGVDLKISKGEFIAITGASGSGKSTLLNVLGCLDRPSSGNYLLEGHNVGGLDDEAISDVRNNRIGFVFQSFHLLTRLSVLEDVPHTPHKRCIKLGTGSAVLVGAVVELYQWHQTLKHANTFSNTLGNETAAKEVLLRQGASSTGALVGGAVGTGLAASLSLGSGGTFALVAAEAYFVSAVADKAMTTWQHDKIYTQKDEGVEWKYNGKNWLREDLQADLVRDGIDNPQKELFAAPFELAHKLSYKASVEAVEQQLNKVMGVC